MTNTSDTPFIDIKFTDTKDRVVSLIREFLNKKETESISGFENSSKKFKEVVMFECIEQYLHNNLQSSSIEYIDYAHGSPGYLCALLYDIDIKCLQTLIDFEYMSFAPCSFFQNIGTLDLNDDYIYYYRHFDEYGNQIFLKQEKKVYDQLIKSVIYQYFKDMSHFNLDVSMGSLPSNMTIHDYRLNEEDFLKNCFRAFLDNPPEYSDEKWSGEEDDLNSRFEFENDHYKRSMSILSKVPDIIKEYEEEKGKDITYNKTSDNDKERLLKLIFYHKVREF